MDKIRFDQYLPTSLESAKYHYCETRFVIGDTITKQLLIEYKFQTTPKLTHIKSLADAAVRDINSHYKCNLVIDHVSYNGLNIIEIYTTIKRTPTIRKKTYRPSSGYSSSTSNSHRDTISWRKAAEQPFVRQAGELESVSFNNSIVTMPIIRTSTSSQTEEQSPETPESSTTNEPVVQPPALKTQAHPFEYGALEYNNAIYHSRLSDNVAFNRTRDLLAYFEDHKTSNYQGETFVSTMNHLANSGLNMAPSKLREVYSSLLLSRGFTIQQINADLESRRNFIKTDQVMRADRAEAVFYRRFSDRGYKRGSCDPELCTIT